MGKVFDEVMKEGRIVTNPRIFSFDYTPERFVHRDEEMKTMARMFRPLLEDGAAVNAIIGGRVGTGKTLLSRKFSEEITEAGEEFGRNLNCVLVNARLKKSDPMILHSIVSHYQPHFPDRGYSFPEMLEILRKDLRKRKESLIVFLDEADAILNKDSEMIYTLTRFNEERKDDTTISLVLVSTHPDLESLMDEGSRDTFKGNTIFLKKYNGEQLLDIMQERIEKGLKPGSLSQDVAALIADGAATDGSARTAIEVMERAGRKAESEGKDEIEAEDVRTAKGKVTVLDHKLYDLDIQHLVLLQAISRSLKKKAYTHTGSIAQNYEIICEELDLKKKGHTRLWEMIKELDSTGIICTKRSGQGVGGNTTLVFIPDVPAMELEEKLTDIINSKG